MGCTLHLDRNSKNIRMLRIMLRCYGWSKSGSGWAVSQVGDSAWQTFVMPSDGREIVVKWN